MCKVCSSLEQKWANERAITGSNIILTCPLVRPSFVPVDSFDDVFFRHFKHFVKSVVNLRSFDSGARQRSYSGCSSISTHETYAVNQG